MENNTQQPNQPLDIKVRIHSFSPGNTVRARASLELGGCFAVRGVKIVDGKHGLFVSMPSYRAGDKNHDICFPVTKTFREQLNHAIFTEYRQQLEQTHLQSQDWQPTGEEQQQERQPDMSFAPPELAEPEFSQQAGM